jgi:hypothetical protein
MHAVISTGLARELPELPATRRESILGISGPPVATWVSRRKVASLDRVHQDAALGEVERQRVAQAVGVAALLDAGPGAVAGQGRADVARVQRLPSVAGLVGGEHRVTAVEPEARACPTQTGGVDSLLLMGVTRSGVGTPLDALEDSLAEPPASRVRAETQCPLALDDRG